MKTTRDSNSAAKNQMRFLSNSIAPTKLTCSMMSASVVGRQRDLEHADDGDVAGDLDDDAEREADQRRRAPAELRHRPDQERALAAAGRTRAGR